MRDRIRFTLSTLMWPTALLAAFAMTAHAQTSANNNQQGRKQSGTVQPAVANQHATGSGTNGQITKWTGSSTIGDSIITETDQGKIGIGTNNPTSKLSVQQGNTIAPQALLVEAGTSSLGTGATGVSSIGGPNLTPGLGSGAGVFGFGGATTSGRGGAGLLGLGGFSSLGGLRAGDGVAATGGSATSGSPGDGLTAMGGHNLSVPGRGRAGVFFGEVVIQPSDAAIGATPGNLHVSGILTKGGGSFKIDHPLDPANKYLYHSFVESPDMMNIYNGNARLDSNGEAVVELPEWFGALNREFRYTLTALGAPGPNLYVAEEISTNHFRIAGGAPGARVSWMVTGIRQDAWAKAHRIPVEEDKSESERGHYLHPELFSQPEEKSIEWARHPGLMQRMKEQLEQMKLRPPGTDQ